MSIQANTTYQVQSRNPVAFGAMPHDAVFSNLNVNRLFATCLNGWLSNSTCNTPPPIVPENLGLYMAPSTTSPPGNDANNGLSFATPVLTFNRIFEIIRAMGYQETAQVYMASGVYPTGNGSNDSCINANTGLIGRQCGPVTFNGATPNVVSTTANVSSIVASSTVAGLASVTIDGVATLVKIGDEVTFPNGVRAQISGIRNVSGSDVTVTMPLTLGLPNTGIVSITRIDGTSGSIVDVFGGTGTGSDGIVSWNGLSASSTKLWFKRLRFNMRNTSASGVTILNFGSASYAFSNNVVVDADVSAPGQKYVQFSGNSIATSGFQVPYLTTAALSLTDYSGLTVDGSNDGDNTTGRIEVTVIESSTLQFGDYNSVRASINLGCNRASVTYATSFKDFTWLYNGVTAGNETQNTLAVQSIEVLDTLTGLNGIELSGSTCSGVVINANFQTSGATTPGTALVVENGASLDYDSVQVGPSGAGTTLYAGGLTIKSNAKATGGTSTLSVQGCSNRGIVVNTGGSIVHAGSVIVSSNVGHGINAESNCTITVVGTTTASSNGGCGIVLVDGSRANFSGALTANTNVQAGVYVSNQSQLISTTSITCATNGGSAVGTGLGGGVCVFDDSEMSANPLSVTATTAGAGLRVLNSSNVSVAGASLVSGNLADHGISVSANSTFNVHNQGTTDSLQCNNNGGNGIDVADNSRVFLFRVSTPGALNTGVGLMLRTNSTASLDFTVSMNTATGLRGVVSDAQCGSFGPSLWRAGAFTFSASNQSVNDYNAPSAAAATSQNCAIMSN